MADSPHYFRRTLDDGRGNSSTGLRPHDAVVRVEGLVGEAVDVAEGRLTHGEGVVGRVGDQEKVVAFRTVSEQKKN